MVDQLQTVTEKEAQLSMIIFTITTQILAHSLSNFYRQQVDRHMDFYAMRQHARANSLLF